MNTDVRLVAVTGDHDVTPLLKLAARAFAAHERTLSRFDPVALKLIGLMPGTNQPGSKSSAGVANNYLTNPVEPNQTDQGDVRIDHKISDGDSFFARFSMSDQVLTPPSAIPPPISAAAFSSGDWYGAVTTASLGAS